MARHRWGYFLTDQELIDLYRNSGGKIGNFDVDDPADICHARRAIFEYLMPGRIRVWYSAVDRKDGMVFFIGKPLTDIRKSVKRDLARRCMEMFKQPPNRCIVVPNSLGLEWDFIAHDRSTHRLKLFEFMQSDRKGDMYPLTPEELELFDSEDD